MAVIKYIGKYVNAEDSITHFDYLEIDNAIKNIKEGAEKLRNSAKRMQDAEIYYSKDDFSINGETFGNRINGCSNRLLATAKYMEDLAESIVQARLKAYNKKQVQLNDEARIQDLRKIKQVQMVTLEME